MHLIFCTPPRKHETLKNRISYFLIKGLELKECSHNLVNINQTNAKKVNEAILFHIVSI